MICSRSEWVVRFVAGNLDDASIRALEGHLEECEECFLRMAAAAGEISREARASLSTRSGKGSRLGRGLKAIDSFAETAVEEASGARSVNDSRKIIGPYLVIGFLGMGGMSIVYRARHQVTGREVAIKTVRTPFVASSLAMLRQEIEFLRETQHPAIVKVLEADLMAEDPWYAMELFEGPTLQEFNSRLWARNSTASEPTALPSSPPAAAGGDLAGVLRLFSRLCEPVGFIHGAGMVHGDMKPANVFLRNDQRPVLMDFGLASRTRGAVGREVLDVTGKIRGTLPYMAPETIRGKLPDARADLYSLGCMLYETLVGVPPFVSSSAAQIIDMHLSRAPLPASARVSGIPVELDELLQRLLAKSPRERFGHASALGIALSSIAQSGSSSPSTLAPPVVISSEATMPLFRPPIIGRDAELESVLEFVRASARSSTGGMFLVGGESGIGKTFFTAEVAQRALLAGVQVITSECLPLVPTGDSNADAGAIPLQGFRRFFERLRDRCHERGQEEVQRLFGERLPLLSSYLPVLRYLRRPESMQAPPTLPAAAARERIVSAVIDTMAAFAADRPVLLALDDLQWADDLSLAVLERLDDDLLGKVPLIVLATYRSDEAHDAIRRLATKHSTRTLNLGRLSRGDIEAMVGGMLSMASAPEALVDYVDVHGEGVPYYAAEYLRSFVAAGALVYRAGAWSTRTDAETLFARSAGELPKTLQDLIRGRLGRLAPELVELLGAAAVLGRRFSLSLIGRMVDKTAGELSTLFTSTVAAHVTISDGFDGYTFLHDRIRETLYSDLAPERRARLHLDAARALDDGAATPPDRYGELGHHLKNGGQLVDAIAYLEKAGAQALAMAANADADRFLREASELEATLPAREPSLRRARWLRQRGDALVGLGKMAESADALRASAALLGRPFPAGKFGLAIALAREILTQVWHRLWPQRIGRRRPSQTETNNEIVRVFERMHEVSFYLGRDADLVFSTTVSLNSAERAGPTPSLAVAYSNAAMMAGVLPLPKLADRYFRLAARAIDVAPDPSAESWLLEMEGHYRVWSGDRERALASLERASRLARDGGFFRRCDEVDSVRVGLDLLAGLHTAAIDRAQEVERRARSRRDLQVQCWAALQQVEGNLMRHDQAAALVALTRAEALAPSLGRPEVIWATGIGAYVRHLRGENDLALELVQRCTDLAFDGPPIHSYCIGPCDRMAETAVALYKAAPDEEQRRSRLKLAARACKVLERAVRVFAIAGPAASLHRGALDLALQPERASAVVQNWRRAIDTARDLDMRLHELRLHTVLLARTTQSDPRWTEGRRRAAELAKMLRPAGASEPAGRPFSAVSVGGVQVERQGDHPIA